MIDEKINELEHKITSINSRMDSFVQQIHDFKNAIDKTMDNLEKQYVGFRNERLALQRVKDDRNEKYEEQNRKTIENFCNNVLDKIKKEYAKDKKELIKKTNFLEQCIKNDKFHSLLNQLNKLEDEFHEKAVKIVKKVALNKD